MFSKRQLPLLFVLLAISGCSRGNNPNLAQPQTTPRVKSDRSVEASDRTPVAPMVIDPAVAFEPFSETVNVVKKGEHLLIESNGLPSHGMMTGIRSWQQQVPIPQPYSGGNAWKIPMKPTVSQHPISAKNNLFRGAIAIAVNGVPIFNALNNRGEDAYLAGELDQWGGHCGRGDDYHYHKAPVHLEEVVGKGSPIAFALDGFPIYGYTEADGSQVGELDEYNGQFDDTGHYHYHATKGYPYANGGLRGQVTVKNGQVEPQPKDSPIRPALRPLRGATIVDFENDGDFSTVTYETSEGTGSVTYRQLQNKEFEFIYVQPNGRKRTERYHRHK